MLRNIFILFKLLLGIALSMVLYYFIDMPLFVEAALLEDLLDTSSADEAALKLEAAKAEALRIEAAKEAALKLEAAKAEALRIEAAKEAALKKIDYTNWYILMILLGVGLIALGFFVDWSFFSQPQPEVIAPNPEQYRFNRLLDGANPEEIRGLLQDLPAGGNDLFHNVKADLVYSESAYVTFPEWFFASKVFSYSLICDAAGKWYGVYFTEFHSYSTSQLKQLFATADNAVFGYALADNQHLMLTKVAVVDPETLHYALYQRTDVVSVIIDEGGVPQYTVTDSLFQRYLKPRSS